MLKDIKKICSEIFEERNKTKISDNDKKKYFAATGLQMDEEYQYILENYAGVFLKEDYGYKPLEKSPFTSENGYDAFLAADSIAQLLSAIEKEPQAEGEYVKKEIPQADKDMFRALEKWAAEHADK